MRKSMHDRGDPMCSIILAAGLGKRMRSELPKVIHRICGKPMVEYVLECAVAAGLRRHVVVIGHKGELVRECLRRHNVEFVVQTQQLGTGHAVQVAVDYIGPMAGTAVVLNGDTPLLTVKTLTALLRFHVARGNDATVLSAVVDDATGYGRIIRDDGGEFVAIREDKDSTEEERAILEINSGIYCFRYASLVESLALLRRDNEQGEFYLTDTIQLLKEGGRRVGAFPADDFREVLGVNTAEQLAALESIMKEVNRGGGL